MASSTEIIATKLMGWRADKRSRGCKWTRWTLEDPLDVAIVYDDGYTSGSDYWPNLSNWNDIRRMEDAIAEKSHWDLYTAYLWEVVTGSLSTPLHSWCLYSASVALRATP